MVKLLQLLALEKKKISLQLEKIENEYYEGYYNGFRAGIQFCMDKMQTLEGEKREND